MYLASCRIFLCADTLAKTLCILVTVNMGAIEAMPRPAIGSLKYMTWNVSDSFFKNQPGSDRRVASVPSSRSSAVGSCLVPILFFNFVISMLFNFWSGPLVTYDVKESSLIKVKFWTNLASEPSHSCLKVKHADSRRPRYHFAGVAIYNSGEG